MWNTNNLRNKLFEIGKQNADEKDIAKLLFTLFEKFKLQLENNLQKQIESMFGMEMIKTIKVSHQNKLLTKNKADDITTLDKRRYWMQSEIRKENTYSLRTHIK